LAARSGQATIRDELKSVVSAQLIEQLPQQAEKNSTYYMRRRAFETRLHAVGGNEMYYMGFHSNVTRWTLPMPMIPRIYKSL